MLSIIQELEEDKKHLVLLDEVDDEERALRLKPRETVGKLKVGICFHLVWLGADLGRI